MNQRFIVCVDSDGCVIDGMTIKHEVCFGPSFIDVYKMNAYEEALMEYWLHFNLYSDTRGVNRFIGLKHILEYANEKSYLSLDIKAFSTWVDSSSELSNKSLERLIVSKKEKGEKTVDLEQALAWSNETNSRITKLTKAQKVPFVEAAQALEEVKKFADLAVVSSANKGAVEEEWKDSDLLKYVDVLCTQEEGSKEECLAKLRMNGYDSNHIIMLGDSPGDISAAKKSGVLYYPITPTQENESWRAFIERYFMLFLKEEYTVEIMKNVEVMYNSILN